MMYAEFVFLVILFILLLVTIYVHWKIKQYEDKPWCNLFNDNCNGRCSHITHQQDDIFNISGRVQGQTQWPTGDAYLSIEQITLDHQLNKPNYHDAPPSYEEAMRIAAAGQNSATSSVTAAIPKQSN